MFPKFAVLIFLTLVTCAAVIESFADALFEKWSLVGRGYLIVSGLLIYALSSVFWAYSLKYETLSKGVVMFNVVNILLGVIIGVLYFKEVLSPINIAGIALGVASVILLSL